MSKLDDIFRNRLERMRQELNSYINLNYRGACPGEAAASVVSNASETKKRGGVQEKFLSYMKLNDDTLEEDAYASPQEMSNAKVDVSNKSFKIPDFLSKQQCRPDIDKVLQQKKESFSVMLLRLIDEKGLKDSEVYKKANIDRRLFSKIRGDEDYMPSKKTAISFCLALQLGMEEAKKLLETAGYTLSASSRFDLIIMYLIENKEFNIHFANIVLEDYGEGTLSR